MASTNPRPGRAAAPRRPSAPSPDRYRCPDCQRWIGEHFKTGTLAGHQDPKGDSYTLCGGSWGPIKGLPSTAGQTDQDARFTSPYTQPTLFT